MKSVIVFGAGTMGNGIAQLFAMNSYSVFLFDNNLKALNKGFETIKNSLDRMVKKEKISTDDKIKTLTNINIISDFINLPTELDLIIEAIPENYGFKSGLIKELNDKISSETIFATNTSSISITKLASNYKYPENFIGMHFMNPVPIMQLVEIIKGIRTTEITFNKIFEIVRFIGKTPCLANDYPGFISNRVLMPMINEAIFCLYENIATKEDIDAIMKLGMSHPMGPLTLADFIGLDICLNIMEVLYEGFKDSKYRACPLLIRMVESGKLGRKTGEGFYKY